MVECMHKKYNKKLKKVIVSFKYLALFCDEVITIDNQSWVSIHCYVVQDLCCLFFFFLLIFRKQVTKGKGLNNLIKILMGALENHGDVSNVGATTKLMSFKADGVNVFQGLCKVILIKFKTSLPPFGRYPLHGTSHEFSHANIVSCPYYKMYSSECILQSLYSFFCYNPRLCFVSFYISFFFFLLSLPLSFFVWFVSTFLFLLVELCNNNYITHMGYL